MLGKSLKHKLFPESLEFLSLLGTSENDCP